MAGFQVFTEAEINLLAQWLIGIAGAGLHVRSKILNFVDSIVR